MNFNSQWDGGCSEQPFNDWLTTTSQVLKGSLKGTGTKIMIKKESLAE